MKRKYTTQNICAYKPLKTFNINALNEEFDFIYRTVCGLSLNGGSGGNFDSTVDFSVNTNPNTGGTTFSPNTPQLTTVLYISTINSSQWTWNGTTYVTYVPLNWTLAGNTITSGNFIGSLNTQPLNFRTNNLQRASISATGQFSTVQDALINGLTFGRGKYITSPTNTAGGYEALNSNLTGVAETAFGNWALLSDLSGSNNSAFGNTSLVSLTSGVNNTSVGSSSSANLTTGGANTAIGYGALYEITSGQGNVGVGTGAGRGVTTGNLNIFLFTKTTAGAPVQSGITTGSYNVLIGSNISGLPAATSNNIIVADGQGNRRINIDNIGRTGINTTTLVAMLSLPAGTASAAQMNLPVSTVPTTPNDGDIWREDNTNTGFKIRVNGVTKTIVLA